MSAWNRWVPPAAALLLLVLAFAWVFQMRLGGGDVYPEYSSLRADALGTRALYEALGQVPGMQVERDYRPLARLAPRARLTVLPGLWWQEWQKVPVNELAALHASAGSGARVVLAFRADLRREERDEHGRPVVEEDAAEKKKTDAEDKKKAAAEAKKKKINRLGLRESEPKEIAKEWGVTLKQRWLMARTPGAVREAGAAEGLPEHVAWHSDLYFSVAKDSGWRVLYRRAEEPVLIEKTVGQGTIVLLADAYILSNEAMQRDRATGLLSWLAADYRRVVFLEGSLGVLEENGVGFLARRYGLGGALALAALLGGLYAWRRLVAFLPAEKAFARGELALVHEPAAGFTTLLRRALNPAEVLPSCLEEWRKSRRSGGGSPVALARLEAAWQARDPAAPAAATYNALVRALKPR